MKGKKAVSDVRLRPPAKAVVVAGVAGVVALAAESENLDLGRASPGWSDVSGSGSELVPSFEVFRSWKIDHCGRRRRVVVGLDLGPDLSDSDQTSFVVLNNDNNSLHRREEAFDRSRAQ